MVDLSSKTGTRDDLVELDRDHPGFRDMDYRARRNTIARIAHEYAEGTPVPEAPYTPDEDAVWRAVWDKLAPLHDRYAARQVHEGFEALPLSRASIPQLVDVNARLKEASGFQMMPVAGLVAGRVFLDYLGRETFLATQYIRHSSRPLYTPEPDVVHELVGHAMTLVHPGFARLNRAFGRAVHGLDDADEERVLQVLRAYWYTVEFGLVKEGDALKVVGAGLLSSFGEMGAFEEQAELLPLDLDACGALPFDPTDYQGTLFYAESFDGLVDEVERWLGV